MKMIVTSLLVLTSVGCNNAEFKSVRSEASTTTVCQLTYENVHKYNKWWYSADLWLDCPGQEPALLKEGVEFTDEPGSLDEPVILTTKRGQQKSCSSGELSNPKESL